MKPLTEQQMKAYRAYRQEGGTATLRAWMDQQKNMSWSARAQSTGRAPAPPPQPVQPPAGGPPAVTPPTPVGGTVKPPIGRDPVEPATPPPPAGNIIGPTSPVDKSAPAGKSRPVPASGNKTAIGDPAGGMASPAGTPVGAPATKPDGSPATKPDGSPASPPPPASTTAPIAPGSGGDAQTATMAEVDARARLWLTRMSELEAGVLAGTVSHADYMRENQRFETFMAAAEAGDYSGAMAAQNPFSGGQGATSAAPRRDLAQINAERRANGLGPLSQEIYDAMPERGAQVAATRYNEAGGQMLSNEYAGESQLRTIPRLSQIIAAVGNDPAEIRRRMNNMGATSVIDDISGMTDEQIAGNVNAAAIRAWRQQNPAPAAAAPAAGAQGLTLPDAQQPGPAPASVNKSAGRPSMMSAAPSGPSPMPSTPPSPAAETVPMGGGPTPTPSPSSETVPMGGGPTLSVPSEVNPVLGPKPASGGIKPPPGPPAPVPGTGQKPVGGSIGLPGGPPTGTNKTMDTRAQGREDYMDLRGGMSGKPSLTARPMSPTPTPSPTPTISSTMRPLGGATATPTAAPTSQPITGNAVSNQRNTSIDRQKTVEAMQGYRGK